MSADFAVAGKEAVGESAVESQSSFSIRPAKAENASARARDAKRLHHRQMLRRGVITAFSVALVGLLTTLAVPVVRQLRAWWMMDAAGLYVVWKINDGNWKSGVVTHVNYSQRYSWQSDTPRNLDLQIPWLPNVKSLNLAKCPVTEQALASIRGLDHLRSLNLAWLNHVRYGSPGTGLSDACLIPIQRLSQLQTLTLSGNRITDAGLAMIARMPNLEELYLDATDVSDAGLVHLQGLEKLKTLSLGGTHVTPKGVKALQSALPGLQVEYYNDPELERVLKQFRRLPR